MFSHKNAYNLVNMKVAKIKRAAFDLILYVSVSNFLVMSGRVFLGWSCTKQ